MYRLLETLTCKYVWMCAKEKRERKLHKKEK